MVHHHTRYAAMIFAVVVVCSSLTIQQAVEASVASASASASVSSTGENGMQPGYYGFPAVSANPNQQAPIVQDHPLNQLKQKLVNLANENPTLFDRQDVEDFLNDVGSCAANRFLNQRQGNVRRAFGLTKSALKWRNDIGLNRLRAEDFPCDLFKLGLIFEHGRAHHQAADGRYVETNPIIWLRLGALGSVVKQLERFTPSRLVSYAYNAPRTAIVRASHSIRSRTRRMNNRVRSGGASRRSNYYIRPMIANMSVKENQTINHVLKAIAWWLNDWVNRNPESARATLVLDFEDSDFAFASWSIGEFIIKLDDLFPDLFDQIIGFRYKPKLWSLHSPISMFNRIFKSRISSSRETDMKLKFVTKEPQISAYMPRVDSQGYTMLPAHVSSTCLGPDDSKAPAGCQPEEAGEVGGTALYDPNFWAAIRNEFYYSCKAKPRDH